MLCKHCGENMGGAKGICGACGSWNSPGSLSGTDSARAAEYVDYAAEIKRHATSVPFILGCLLITVGTVGNIFYEFTWHSIFDAALSSVYISALWLLVCGSLFSKASSITLATLSMLKFSVVLYMILTCIVFGLMGIAALFGMALLFLAIIGGIGYLIVKYYFLALLNVLDGIKHRITTGKYSSFDGLGSFFAISCVGIGLSFLIELAEFAGIFNQVGVSAPITAISMDAFGNITELGTPAMVAQEASSPIFPWLLMFVIADGAGLLLCLRTLKRFE